VRLRDATEAASPLMVIATFVLVAAGLTALLFFAFVDTAPPSLSLQQDAGAATFQVVALHGSIDWSHVQAHFVDHAGTDHATWLDVPTSGAVHAGDRITLKVQPPAGQYLLRIFDGDRELARAGYASPPQ